MSSFVLRGGTIVNPDGNFNADVVVRNGVIATTAPTHHFHDQVRVGGGDVLQQGHTEPIDLVSTRRIPRCATGGGHLVP